jgi:hypothetical protein
MQRERAPEVHPFSHCFSPCKAERPRRSFFMAGFSLVQYLPAADAPDRKDETPRFLRRFLFWYPMQGPRMRRRARTQSGAARGAPGGGGLVVTLIPPNNSTK